MLAETVHFNLTITLLYSPVSVDLIVKIIVIHETSDGVPIDGVPNLKVVTVSLGVTVVYMMLATTGFGFAIVCLLFTFVFRNKRSCSMIETCLHSFIVFTYCSMYCHIPFNAWFRLIRLSSPNLNYIIGLGAIILYLNVIVLVIPTKNSDFAAVLCNVSRNIAFDYYNYLQI